MSNSPFFSIIIPTYNRPKMLQNCLESLSALDYPKDDFEVVVVDDGSPVSLEEIVLAFQGRLRIIYFRQENAGPASARNYGARNAKGTYLAFTDDDCKPAKNWLSLMKAELDKKPDHMLGGKTINILKDNLFSSTSQFIVDLVYDHYNQDPNDSRFFASNNIVVPTKIFNKIGGFPEDFSRAGGEDREFCERWFWLGYKMSYLEEAKMYHQHYLTLKKFYKQHFNYGIGAYHFHRTRRERKSGNMSQELKFHVNLNNWLFAPFARKEKKPVAKFFLLMVWQVANLFGFMYARYFEKA